MFKFVGNIVLQIMLIGLASIMLSDCSNGEPRLPIEEPLLINVLCDVHIIEGAIQNRTKSTKDSVANLYYQQVYEKHQIKEEDFIKTLEILEKNPKILEVLYSKVLIQLDTLEQHSYKSKYKKK